MNHSIGRRLRFAGLPAILAISSVSLASAQTREQLQVPAPSLAGVKAIVPTGEVVTVTDATGATTTGQLAGVADDAVRIQVKGSTLTMPADSVRRIRWERRDSPLNGVLIGAAIGAIPGVYWLIADPNECTGMCPEEYALIGIGATVGGVVDYLVRKTVTVYNAPTSSGHPTSVAVVPILTRTRRGVQLAVRF